MKFVPGSNNKTWKIERSVRNNNLLSTHICAKILENPVDPDVDIHLRVTKSRNKINSK